MTIFVTKVETSNGPLIDIFYTVYQLRRQRCVVTIILFMIKYDGD